MKITEQSIENYRKVLYEDEKSQATIEKYIRDIYRFAEFTCFQDITKNTLIQYKDQLMKTHQCSSINSMLIAIHSFLDYLGCKECKVKLIKIQKNHFLDKDKELTRAEYERLLKAAKNNQKLFLLIQTICSTGIRVSEHQYITVEAIKQKKAVIHNKGKVRYIFFPKKLRKELLLYCQHQKIVSGPIFITCHGNPMNRSNIWSSMKALCQKAHVEKNKVFPHNLRHLFAYTYYSIEKDLVRLADILGHTSIETTRIYTMTSINECEDLLSRLNLLELNC